MWIKGNFRIIKESNVWWKRIIGVVSSFVLKCNQLGLISRFSFQNTTIVHSRGSNAVLKKLNWATGQTLTQIGLELVFQRSTQAVDSSLAAKMSKFPPSVLRSNIPKWKDIFGKK